MFNMQTKSMEAQFSFPMCRRLLVKVLRLMAIQQQRILLWLVSSEIVYQKLVFISAMTISSVTTTGEIPFDTVFSFNVSGEIKKTSIIIEYYILRWQSPRRNDGRVSNARLKFNRCVFR